MTGSQHFAPVDDRFQGCPVRGRSVTIVQDGSRLRTQHETMHSDRWLSIGLILGVVGCTHPSVHVPSDSEEVLRAKTQALLDAVTEGDRKVWDENLDPRAVYVSEAGEIRTKAELLEEIVPLPQGISGSLTVAESRIELFGTTAVVVHVDAEKVDYYGHPLAARYMATTVWQLGSDGWKVIGAQVHASLTDPPTVELTAQQLDEYVGTYRLAKGLRKN